MSFQGDAEGRQTLEYLINAATVGTRLAVRSRQEAGVPAEAIRRELLDRMHAEFDDDDEPLLNASLIAAVRVTLGELLN